MEQQVEVRHFAPRRTPGTPMSQDEVSYDEARARNEQAKADINEMKAQQMAGNLLPRNEFRDASATSMAMIAQSLRSLSDNLERVAGLAPEQAQIVDTVVNDCLADIAATFKRFCRDG